MLTDSEMLEFSSSAGYLLDSSHDNDYDDDDSFTDFEDDEFMDDDFDALNDFDDEEDDEFYYEDENFEYDEFGE